jgi:acetyl-CoA carboxylase carboxyl transferase subunit beta
MSQEKVPWWKRLSKGVNTTTEQKLEAPDGVWHKCKGCKKTFLVTLYRENLNTCPECSYHERIDAEDYFEILFDDNHYQELYADLVPTDFLHFTDTKSYATRIVDATKATDLKESMRVGTGMTSGNPLTVAAMDFRFIGGSMGSVMGEKISRGIDHAIAHRTAFMIVSRTGGARMQESAFSLMQMAKTSAKLYQLANAGLPYISLCTNPTTGGVTASFAMLGDFNIAEPGALIGFAGPRVIEETVKKKLPAGFQTSEFQLDNGFLDFIVHRKQLKDKVGTLLHLIKG